MADSPQELLQQAIHAFSQGDLATAEGLSDRLVALAPRDVNAWLLRGRVAGRSGRWKRAEEALDRAAKLAPREGDVPFARAMIRMKQGRFAAAAELLEKAERLKPDHPDARSARAECLRQMGEPGRALELLGRAPKSLAQAVTIGEALADLDEPYRETVSLRYFGELSLNEIAEVTGRPLGTVKTHLHRGLLRLRTSLEGRVP